MTGLCECGCGKSTSIAKWTDRSHGWVKGKSKRFIHGHSGSGRRGRHCMWNTPEYSAYSTAKARCTNLKMRNWLHYGGRGIKFLFASFEEFYAEVGPRPIMLSPGGRSVYSLDRINNDGHYEPGNVRWATSTEQYHNRRKGVKNERFVVYTR